MTIEYNLTENDVLQHQLYIVSISKRIKKIRKRNWLLLTFCCFLLTLMFYQTKNNVQQYYFLIVGFLCLFFYPIYQRRFYLRHYKKSTQEYYKTQTDNSTTVTFDESQINIVTKTSETRFNLIEIDEIVEILDFFFLRVSVQVSLVIPKNQIKNPDEVKLYLVKLSEKLNINYIQDLNWKWK
jgi:hypothetical protein